MQSQLNNLLINLSEPKPYTRLIQKDEDYYLKASIFKQSSRLVYRSTLSFWDVEKICKHTNVKPEGEEQQLIDITNVKNRYLEPKHGNEIINYITNNIDNFILPNLTSLTDKPFTVCKDVNSNELYTEVFEELKQANGYLEAYIKIPVGTTFSISDGNHRTYAIHQLVKKQILNPQIDGLYIGIDFYLEDDVQTEKKLFVTLNSGKPIDSSVMAFLNEDDMLSFATKSLLGIEENHQFSIHAFQNSSEHYIGIDLLNSNITKSNNTVSFNMVKNMISLLAFNQLNADKKFADKYMNNRLEYLKLMQKISLYLNFIFKNCPPFQQIDNQQSNVKDLRKEYISMSGAGLYTIAKVGHIAIIHDEISIEALAKAICSLNWKKVISNQINPLFEGGIVTPDGKISNNRNSLGNTTEKIKEILNITDKDIEQLLKK